jgi:3-oxoacyl-[acyl-carrier protein] reductase
MLIEFHGKRVVVAGAARGIGQAITDAFAADGAHVFACDVLVDQLRPRAGPRDGGGRVSACHVDVTSPASIAEVIAAVDASGGPADVLVYVAGGVRGQRPKPVEEVTLTEFEDIVAVNLTGAFLCAQAVVPGMKRARQGRIITISSRAGLATSLTGIQSYASAKHGQVGLVKQLAQELGEWGITVNSVAPGFMATSPDYERQWASYSEDFKARFHDRIAMRRMGVPQDIAGAVLFLASEHASWITGQTLLVNGSPLA